MPERGVLYIVWGAQAAATSERSRRSLREHHPELPVEFVRLDDSLDPIRGLAEKARMMDLSPFDETLYLDADTVVFGRLDFGFEKAAKHGMACTVCECPWGRRYGKALAGDIIEYNTGVLFFTKKVRPVFDAWRRLAVSLDSSCTVAYNGNQSRVSAYNDQCGFAAAVEETGFNPFVLPLNWNFRPRYQKTLFGPVRIWHDYADPPVLYHDMARYYANPDSVIQYLEFE